MAINCISPLLSGILLASLFQAVFLSENDGCPAIHVKKDQIIRTREALNNGAKYLHKEIVQSARECYKLCCGHDQCNLGMLSYKNNSMDHLVRTCFLFDCGSPSKCSFSPYKHYATISFDGKRQGGSRGIKQSNSDSSSQGSERWDKDCPPGAPVAMCSLDPCHTATCRGHPWAICRPSTCGTCHAEFFNSVGQRVKCYENSKQAKPLSRHSSTNKWSDKSILKEIESLHQKGIHNPPVHHRNHNTDLETHLQDYTRKNPSSHQSSTGSSSKEIESSQTEPETDPPFHHWREFIDNNPKFGKPKLVTEKPTTKKPTTFHQWRDFIDNNPKYTKRPAKTTTTKPTAKTTKKTTKSHVKPKTKPMIEENPMTNSPPKVDDQSRRITSNISDVVVIETSNLRIVENKAVVPLAIFLVVALVMLFVVALRLRVTKRRLRRKAFATDDADYLINGMYL